MVETPDSGPPTNVGGNLISANHLPGELASVISVHESTGHLNWFEVPPAIASDKIQAIRQQPAGDAVMVIESQAHDSSVLVRTGPSAHSTPWRYRSVGTLGPEMVMDSSGAILMMETPRDRFPRLAIFDGLTGNVMVREPLPSGVHVVLNVGCVPGANAARMVPAQVGPPAAQLDGSLMFEIVTSDGLENFERCGSVSGYVRRNIMLATVKGQVKHVDSLRLYEVPAGSTPPTVTLHPVSGDGHGGFLAPWTAAFGDGNTRESRVTHIADAGQQEYSLPVAGPIWLAGKDDLALTSDGSTIVVFNVLTGAVRSSHFYPKGVKILKVKNGEVLLHSANLDEVYDANGLLEPRKPPQ